MHSEGASNASIGNENAGVKRFAVFFIVSGFFSVLFSVYPEIDILVSGLFYDADNGFFLRKNFFLVFLYESIEVFVPAVIVFCLLSIVFFRLKRKKIFGLGCSGALYLLVALAVGPGLLVNGILKEFWGRARPSTIEEFGGKMIFTPALLPSNQCESNCSFASGHASAGFFPVSMSFVWRKHRKKFFCAGILYGIMAGFARIAQGGHFLSDVVFAGLIVYGISWLLWSLYERLQRATPLRQVLNKR